MKKLNQNGAIDLMFVAVLVVLVAATAFTLWRINQADETVSDTEANTSNQSILTKSGSDSEERPEEDTIEERSASWASVTTGLEGLTFSVPDGWELLGGADADNVFGDEITYTEGTPGTLELLEAYGSDKPWRVVLARQSNEATYEFDGYTESSFSVDGIEGTKNTRTYASDYTCEGLGCNLPGDTHYTYVIPASDTEVFYASYTVGESETDQIELFEEMLDTVVFN